MTKIFRVRKYRTGDLNGKTYHSYRFTDKGCTWTYKELEELESFKIIFSSNMSSEDIDKVNEKWKHKIL